MSETKGIIVSWQYEFSLSKKPNGWREHVAATLRRLAERIDGRRSLAVTLNTTPPISRASSIAVLVAGARAMERAVRIEVEAAVIEEGMRELYPGLYEESSHGG